MIRLKGSVRAKLGSAFGLLLVLVVFMSVWGWFSMHRMNDLNDLKNKLIRQQEEIQATTEELTLKLRMANGYLAQKDKQMMEFEFQLVEREKLQLN